MVSILAVRWCKPQWWKQSTRNGHSKDHATQAVVLCLVSTVLYTSVQVPVLGTFCMRLFNSKQSSGLKDLYLKPPSLSLFSVLYFLCASFVSTAMNQIQLGLLAYIGRTSPECSAQFLAVCLGCCKGVCDSLWLFCSGNFCRQLYI